MEQKDIKRKYMPAPEKIIEDAIVKYKPVKIMLMVSGGHDFKNIV